MFGRKDIIQTVEESSDISEWFGSKKEIEINEDVVWVLVNLEKLSHYYTELNYPTRMTLMKPCEVSNALKKLLPEGLKMKWIEDKWEIEGVMVMDSKGGTSGVKIEIK